MTTTEEVIRELTAALTRSQEEVERLRGDVERVAALTESGRADMALQFAHTAARRRATLIIHPTPATESAETEPSGQTIAEQEAIAMELHAASDDPVSPSFDDLPSRERRAYFELASRIQEVVTAHRAEPEQDGSAPEGPIKAIWLHGDGRDMVVEVEFVNRPNEWVEVIREHSGHPEVVTVSHFVEAAGIARARKGR